MKLEKIMTAPYQKHSKTSKDAAEKVDVGQQEAIAYGIIKRLGGATGDKIAELMNVPIGTASARIVGLRDKGFIETTEKREMTRSGRYGFVHMVKESK